MRVIRHIMPSNQPQLIRTLVNSNFEPIIINLSSFSARIINSFFHLPDDENSSVYGMVTEEGLFDGTISTASGEIYIEPTSRYAPPVCHRQDGGDNDTTDAMHHHTIAYRSVDVNIPRRSGYPCASELLRGNTLNELR